MLTRSITPIVLLFVAAFVGCGSGVERHAMRGEVTKNGKPVSDGAILFLPRGSGGPSAATSIVGGQYEFDMTNGPYAGTYRVVIGVEADDAEVAEWKTLSSISEETVELPSNLKVSVLPDPVEVEKQEKLRKRKRLDPPPPPPKVQWEFDCVIGDDDDDQRDFVLE